MDGISNNLTGGLMKTGSLLGPSSTGKAADKNTAGNMLDSFGNMLQEQMNNINTLQANADKAAETYATGGDIELHNVILATDKADMALQLALQVRNKMLNAYQEISRMTS